MKTYYGHALLNGPGGATDTPEVDIPIEVEAGAVPTESALVITAADRGEAHRKQIMWHALIRRANDLRYEPSPVAAYNDRRREAIAMLERMADEAIQ
ncbi:MAG: hypothetical protein ACYSUI_19255 [Planctomycetota bacterium]|jgi:hypothetical protein